MTDDALLDDLGRRLFRPFFDSAHPHTGLVPGTFSPQGRAHPAATGLALGALVIGAERGWESRAECRACAERVLRTLWRDAAHRHGFFASSIDPRTGQASDNAAPFTLDTAEIILGAFTAARYFGGAVAELAAAIEARVDWPRAVGADGRLLHRLPGEIIAPATWQRFGPHLSATWFASHEATRPAVASVWTSWRRDLADTSADAPGRLREHLAFQAWLDWRAHLDLDGVNHFASACVTARAVLAAPDHSFARDLDLVAGALPFAPSLALEALRHGAGPRPAADALTTGRALLLTENHRSGLVWTLLGPWSPRGRTA